MPTRPTRRSTLKPARAGLPLRPALLTVAAVLILVPLLVLTGCASRVPSGAQPDVEPAKEKSGIPVCLVIEGDPDIIPEAEDSVWWRDGGSMRCVVTEDSLSLSRDDALASAAGHLLPGAFEMLERRGAALSEARRDEVAAAFARAVARGEDLGFPRISVRESVVERCSPAGADERWRARLYAEYPIGVLRGDATHAQWEERRILREIVMRLDSAERFLEDGRWHEAALERLRAVDAELFLGPATQRSPEGVEALSRLAKRNLPRLEIVPLDGEETIVVPAGGRVTARYHIAYDHDGRRVPASGMPVSFASAGDFRLAPLAAETDASGDVVVEIVAAGEAAEGVVSVTAELVRPASLAFVFGVSADEREAVAVREQSVVVHSEREATVCVEINTANVADADRVREAIANGVDALGSSLVDCGPDAALVVSVNVSVSSEDAHGVWVARATCEVKVFDQRLAHETGSIGFDVVETLGSSARDAEVLTLREAGRLVVVYLEPRLEER